jgi:endonuclease/exonuclease/phosphatase family metal-dependent hydrolase
MATQPEDSKKILKLQDMCSKQYSEKADMHLLAVYCFLLLITFIQPLFGCSYTNPNNDVLTIATFNIAWLGDDKDPETLKRSDEDIVRIADVIQETSADVIALQEIENKQAMQRILALLPQYAGVLGTKGKSQNVGFLYKSSIQVQDIGEYLPLAVDPSRNRPGYVIQVKKGNFDCIMMSVHFKSTSRFDSTDELRSESRLMRMEQSKRAIAWMDSILRSKNEEDILIIGDFNDFPKRTKEPTLKDLSDSRLGTFLTADLKSCKYPHLFAIDHIYASSTASMRFTLGSEHMIDIHSMYPKDLADKVSDHCPVILQFDTTKPDND